MRISPRGSSLQRVASWRAWRARKRTTRSKAPSPGHSCLNESYVVSLSHHATEEVIGDMKQVAILFFVLWFLVLLGRPAYAYLDPGTGSMMLQVLLGGVAAFLVIVKLQWRRFLRFLGIDMDEAEKDKSDTAAEDS